MNQKYLLYFGNSGFPPLKESLRRLLEMNFRPLVSNMRQRASYLMGFTYPRFMFRMAERYNRFEAGIAHNTHNLICLLKEAAYLGRTAVVMPISPLKDHNFGKMVDVTVDKYYDLKKSFLYENICENSERDREEGRYLIGPSLESIYADCFIGRKIKIADEEKRKLNYIPLEDFIRTGSSFFRGVRFLSHSAPISEEENERWPLIVRHLNPSYYVNAPAPDYKNYKNFFDTNRVNLEYVDKINRLAETISSRLGKNYYYLAIRVPWEEHRPFNEEQVRQGLRPSLRDALWPFYSPECLCKKIAEFFPPGSVLYIASNLWKPHDEEYFSRLKSAYKVYRCYDFPELVPFVEGPTPNTSQLNLVENMISYGSARYLKIHRERGVYLSGRKIC